MRKVSMTAEELGPPDYKNSSTLSLRCCAARFACRTPTWRLPVSGHVVELVTDAVHWVSGSGTGRKRVRLNRKTPAHLAGLMVHSRPRVWKRLRRVGHSSVSIPDHKRRRGDQDRGGSHPAQVRTGVGQLPGFVQAHFSRFARF